MRYLGLGATFEDLGMYLGLGLLEAEEGVHIILGFNNNTYVRASERRTDGLGLLSSDNKKNIPALYECLSCTL